MATVFIKLLNISITASRLVLAVALVRLIFKKSAARIVVRALGARCRKAHGADLNRVGVEPVTDGGADNG